MKYNKVNKCLDFESVTRHGCRVSSVPWMGLKRLSNIERLSAVDINKAQHFELIKKHLN
jgi:hypothetical protein